MKKIVFTLIGILSAIIVNSQVSQDSALAILRTNIADADNYDIYTTNGTINYGDTIKLLSSKIIIPPQGIYVSHC